MNQLPNGWRRVKLGEVYKFTLKPRTRRISDVDAVPFVPMNFVPIGKVFFEEFTLKTPSQISSGTYFERGDILVAKITPSFENGKQGIIDDLPTEFGIATTEVIPIQAIPEVSDRIFLFYYLLLSKVRSDLAGKMEGSTGRQRLGKSALEDLVLNFPSLMEQCSIATALQTVQDAKNARTSELQLEREHKAALMANLFSHGTRGVAAVETPLGKLPRNWEVVKLGDVLRQAQYGLSLRGETSGTYPILRMTNLVEGLVEMKNLQFVELDKKTFNQYKINFGDVLFNRTNSFELVGKTAIYESDAESIFASYLIRLIPKSESLASQFLNAYFNSGETQKRLKSIASRGVSQSNISAGNLKHFLIPLPPLDEQREIAAILRACDDKIAALEDEATRLEELFRAMLEELMSGRISVAALLETTKPPVW